MGDDVRFGQRQTEAAARRSPPHVVVRPVEPLEYVTRSSSECRYRCRRRAGSIWAFSSTVNATTRWLADPLSHVLHGVRQEVHDHLLDGLTIHTRETGSIGQAPDQVDACGLQVKFVAVEQIGQRSHGDPDDELVGPKPASRREKSSTLSMRPGQPFALAGDDLVVVVLLSFIDPALAQAFAEHPDQGEGRP